MMRNTQERTCKSIRRIGHALVGFLVALLALPSLASALVMIDFEEFSHGEVITAAGGVTIEAENFKRDFDLAVIFNSDFDGPTADDDLTFDNGGSNPGGPWSGGNLQGTSLGNMLILQENEAGCATGVCSNPDDEGRRPAGTLSFLFDVPITSFGFALIDIDSLTAENGAITFYNDAGDSSSMDFATLLAGYVIGNNTANTIKAFDLTQLEFDDVTKVEFLMGGSGAIDNVNFEPVPEPTTALLMGLGLAGLAHAGRRPKA